MEKMALLIGYSQVILSLIEVIGMFVSLAMAPIPQMKISNHNMIYTGFLSSALFTSGICSINSRKRATSAMLTGIVTFSVISGFYCCVDVVRYGYVIVVNIVHRNTTNSFVMPPIICALAIVCFIASMSAILYNVKILDNICRYSTSRMTAFQANVIAKSFVGPVTTATTINVRHKSEIKMAIMQGVGGVLLFIIGITSIFVLDGQFASFAVIDAILFMSSSYLGLLKVKRRKPGVLVWFLVTSRLCRTVTIMAITHSTYELTRRIYYNGVNSNVLGIYCPLISITIYCLISTSYTTTAVERQLRIQSWSFGKAYLSRNIYDVINFRLGCLMFINGLSLLLIGLIYLLTISFKIHVTMAIYLACLLCVTGGFGINAADIRSEQVETAFMALSSYVVMVSTITIGIIVYQYTTADYEGLQLALLMMALALSVVAVVCAGIAASCAGRHSGSCCGGRKDTSAEDERM